jgi:hypothetical protein
MAYVPVILWIISNVVGLFILKKRRVTLNFFWILFGVLFGPLALPFCFFVGTPKTSATHSTHSGAA